MSSKQTLNLKFLCVWPWPWGMGGGITDNTLNLLSIIVSNINKNLSYGLENMNS